jgi:prophage antirepressor-like protein
VSDAIQQIEDRLKEAGIIDGISNTIKLPVENYSEGGAKTQEYICVNQKGIYELIFSSRKK